MNTNELLSDIKRAVTVPDYQKRYDNSDLLRFSFINLNSKILQVLMQVDEEYNVKYIEIDHLAQQEYIEIPDYFVGQQVRAVMYKANGSDIFRNLVRYELRERFTNTNQPGMVRGFSFQDDRMYFHPVPQDAGTVLFFFRKKHPKLVLPSEVAKVASASGTTVTLTDVPPSTFAAGVYLDFTKSKANYQNKVMYEQLASVSGTTLTMVNPVTDWGLVAGDEVSLHNETSIVQLPDEMHECLVWSVCIDIVKGLNIPDQIQSAQEEYARRVEAALEILKPRSKDSLATIVQYNGLLARPFRRFPAVTV